MVGFTIICNDCRAQSELKEENQRLSEFTKILIHDLTEICLVCANCDQKLKLK